MPISPDNLITLINCHWGPLLAMVGRDRPWAEDVVQLAFVRLAAEEPPPDNPVAWLYRVTRREAINQWKQAQRRRHRQVAVAQAEVTPDDAGRQAESQELLEQLQQLEDDARQVLVARIWGQLSWEEIMRLTGKSRTTVWRLYRAALVQLRFHYDVPCPTEKK